MPEKFTKDEIKIGQEIIEMETAGLVALKDSLGQSFVDAIDRLYNTTGKVIVTGMGKSGHIGSKIAATLASTGTPSFFIHPAEASHGDLGMISKDDTVVAISYSGESRELGDIVNFTRRHGIPLISIVSNPESTLARNSDITVLLPKSKEACPLGLAPTTSTTQTLALGDAIAMVLLEKKGFSRDEFRDRHPGGKLGQILVMVKDLMHKGDEIPLVKSDSLMSEALLEMTSKGFGCTGIIDKDDKLIGIITDGDLRRKMSADLPAQKVSAIFTPNPKTISEKALGGEALAMMNGFGITSLFVTDETGALVGIIHVHDCMRAGIA